MKRADVQYKKREKPTVLHLLGTKQQTMLKTGLVDTVY